MTRRAYRARPGRSKHRLEVGRSQSACGRSEQSQISTMGRESQPDPETAPEFAMVAMGPVFSSKNS